MNQISTPTQEHPTWVEIKETWQHCTTTTRRQNTRTNRACSLSASPKTMSSPSTNTTGQN